MTVEGRDVVLRVKDYGIGFDAESAQQTGSLGLVSMRERLRMVEGWDRDPFGNREGNGSRGQGSA